MTFDDFMRKMLDAFPNAQAGEDNDGQLIIYTDLMEDANGNVVSYIDSDEQEKEKGEAEQGG